MTPAADPSMPRRFGLLQATALNMSNMMGAGPFITIPLLMSAMGGPQAMLGWVVALVITVADGLVWSELGAAMPHSGGTYGYLRASFGKGGPFMAFLFIWQLIISGPLEIASGYIGFGQYLRYLWPEATDFEVKLAGALVGVVVIFLLYRQIQGIARLMVSLWVGVMIAIVAVIATGVMHFDAKVAFDFPPDAFQFSWGFLLGLGVASRVGIYDYLGYYDVCYIGDEVKEPGRVIPLSVMVSLVSVALIYMGINLSIIGTVPWREFVPAADPLPPVASMFMEKIHGRGAAQLFTLLVLWTIVAGVVAPHRRFSASVAAGDWRVVHRLRVPAFDDRDRRASHHPHGGSVHRSNRGAAVAAQAQAGDGLAVPDVVLSAAGIGGAGGLGVPDRHANGRAACVCRRISGTGGGKLLCAEGAEFEIRRQTLTFILERSA